MPYCLTYLFLILAPDTVVVPDIEGQREHRALQQQVQGFHVKIRETIAVFHADLHIRRANGRLAAVPEASHQFVELNMNPPQYQTDQIDRDRLRKIREEYGIYFTIHLDENLNPADFNPYIAQAYLRTVEDAIALAKREDIPVLNMHLSRGVYFTMPEKKIYCSANSRHSFAQSSSAGSSINVGIPKSIMKPPFPRTPGPFGSRNWWQGRWTRSPASVIRRWKTFWRRTERPGSAWKGRFHRIGRRISGVPIWARTAPSRNSTMEWTMLCRWITTST